MPDLMSQVRMLKNEVLMKSSHKLKNQRSEHIQAIEQPLISLDLKFFIKQMKLRYLKSFLQSRSSLLPSYCTCGEKAIKYERLVSSVRRAKPKVRLTVRAPRNRGPPRHVDPTQTTLSAVAFRLPMNLVTFGDIDQTSST